MNLWNRIFGKRRSVLIALQEQDPEGALEALARGGNRNERDLNGNLPSHYAAAYGFTEVLTELAQRDADLISKNQQGDTPLMYAVLHGQPETAQYLWTKQRDQVHREHGPLGSAVVELCAIGVEIQHHPDETVSGFVNRDANGDWVPHARAVEIGNELLNTAGFSGMQRVANAVGQVLGPRAANKLSRCWNGIGSWMH